MDDFPHSRECEDSESKTCICDEVYFAKLDEAADAQFEYMRGN